MRGNDAFPPTTYNPIICNFVWVVQVYVGAVCLALRRGGGAGLGVSALSRVRVLEWQVNKAGSYPQGNCEMKGMINDELVEENSISRSSVAQYVFSRLSRSEFQAIRHLGRLMWLLGRSIARRLGCASVVDLGRNSRSREWIEWRERARAR
ncbi:hypothetical protein F4677DRAFT_208585 [Hypoxylon crocopeplum]|nr:hypothetical protein F4677DRAFT_208585 [Hypoxylon crocopeplum]